MCFEVPFLTHNLENLSHFNISSTDCQEALFNPNCMTKVLLEDIKKRCRRDREGEKFVCSYMFSSCMLTFLSS